MTWNASVAAGSPARRARRCTWSTGRAAFAWTASRSPNGCVPRNGRDRGVSVSGLGYHTLARTDGVPFRYRCPRTREVTGICRCRGGAVVARRPHAPKVAGSSPAPATTSWSGRRRSFPASVRRRILERDPACRCAGCPDHQGPCGQPSRIADHVVPWAEGGPDTIENGQGLCDGCHAHKTRAEIARGMARRPPMRRPSRPHPGLT